MNDSKLIKLQNTEESDGSELSEEIRDVAHATIKKNNQNSYAATERVNEEQEARFAILALNRDRVEHRKIEKEKFRKLLGIIAKKKKNTDGVKKISYVDPLKTSKIKSLN
jgi:hypothetical protein